MNNLFNETYDISEYSETNYPYYKYLLYCTYPNLEILKNQLEYVDNDHNKYPIINAYLNREKNEKEILEVLPIFNEFTNKMLNNYSFKITRKEAENRPLKDEIIYIENKQLCDDFIKSWNDKLKDIILIENDNDNDNKKIKKELKAGLTINYFLVDEFCRENYLYNAYKKFIERQNNILEPILNKLYQNGLFFELRELINNPIDVYNATANEIINFNNITKSKLYNLLYTYSFRDISINQKKIDYIKYKNIEFNLQNIENNLGDILLHNKRLFSCRRLEVR